MHSLLMKYFEQFKQHPIHSLVFWGRGNRVDVLIRGTNLAQKVGEISMNDFIGMHRSITHAIGNQPFPTIYQQMVAKKLETQEVIDCLGAHLNVTHQPQSGGAFIMALTLSLDYLIENGFKNESVNGQPKLDNDYSDLVDRAAKAQTQHQYEMTWIYSALSDVELAPFHEFEQRKEPLALMGSYAPYWGLLSDYNFSVKGLN